MLVSGLCNALDITESPKKITKKHLISVFAISH